MSNFDSQYAEYVEKHYNQQAIRNNLLTNVYNYNSGLSGGLLGNQFYVAGQSPWDIMALSSNQVAPKASTYYLRTIDKLRAELKEWHGELRSI